MSGFSFELHQSQLVHLVERLLICEGIIDLDIAKPHGTAHPP